MEASIMKSIPFRDSIYYTYTCTLGIFDKEHYIKYNLANLAKLCWASHMCSLLTLRDEKVEHGDDHSMSTEHVVPTSAHPL